SFRRGSLLLEGSVVLLSWAGTLVLEAARAEISEVLRVAFRRTLTNALNDLPASLSHDVGAMEMTVTETTRPSVNRSPTPRASGAVLFYAVLVWIICLTALVLLLVADRFFVISTPPPVPIPQPSPTATTSPTTTPSPTTKTGNP